ncbi:dna replication complex gins protein psf2 [Zymoseptoria brevis]|uniref:DNA replication complex GINS protein PSF2 n=1 Tax=Zymoseptoria brevis TaxID=1047168 RepID=A0A0F4G6X4_9PEZI|nr:dna replication complex gins protein psf2 [Zymoseptoria brevis]
MALPLPPGLTPNEVGFLCEMELVTIIPRQRLDSLELLGGPTNTLTPPFPTTLPLWLALLLKRQNRANISPPPWLTLDSLTALLEFETSPDLAGVLAPSSTLPAPRSISSLPEDPYLADETLELSPPFVKDACTSKAQDNALPFHWLEVAHLLLTHAAEDFEDGDQVRRLVRDLREVRMSKLRKGFAVLDAGGAVKLNGVGALEVAEVRGFVGGVVDGLRKINRSREEARREGLLEERDGLSGNGYQNSYDDDEDDVQL